MVSSPSLLRSSYLSIFPCSMIHIFQLNSIIIILVILQSNFPSIYEISSSHVNSFLVFFIIFHQYDYYLVNISILYSMQTWSLYIIKNNSYIYCLFAIAVSISQVPCHFALFSCLKMGCHKASNSKTYNVLAKTKQIVSVCMTGNRSIKTEKINERHIPYPP